MSPRPVGLRALLRCHASVPCALRARTASTRTLPPLPLFQSMMRHDPESPAVALSSYEEHAIQQGPTYSYRALLEDVAAAKDRLKQRLRGRALRGERIALFAERSYHFVGTALHAPIAVLTTQCCCSPSSLVTPSLCPCHPTGPVGRRPTWWSRARALPCFPGARSSVSALQTCWRGWKTRRCMSNARKPPRRAFLSKPKLASTERQAAMAV